MGPSSKHTPRSPTYLIPCVIALALFSLTGLLLYKVLLSPTPSFFSPCPLPIFLSLFILHHFFALSVTFPSLGNFVEQVDDVASRTGTVVGHNLEPTPWHVFPHKPFDEESRQQRAYKILQCSYLTCRYAAEALGGARRRTGGGREECPKFFRAIHRDLAPWSESRISKAHVAAAQRYAAFRVVIVEGKVFVDWYYACVQSRAMFTLWGLLQLMRRYPGMVPDVDMMFDCMDKPSVNRTEHQAMPLPLFRYCTTKEHFDIPFPDWSFWGW